MREIFDKLYLNSRQPGPKGAENPEGLKKRDPATATIACCSSAMVACEADAQTGTKARRGFNEERVEAEEKRKGKLLIPEIIRCRVRYLLRCTHLRAACGRRSPLRTGSATGRTLARWSSRTAFSKPSAGALVQN